MKERLVGAAVLVAIAVWLIPWVLDGPEAPLEPNGGSLQLPAAEEPMPMRTQTLRLGGAPETSQASVEEPPVAAAAAAPPPVSVEPDVTTAAAVTAEAPAEPLVAVARPEPARPAPAATAPRETPPKPAASAAATGDWTVQLGSFSDEANARRVAQRSGTFGYKADVSTVKSGGRTLYRVRVGSARSRGEAEATVSALKAHGIDASVVAAR